MYDSYCIVCTKHAVWTFGEATPRSRLLGVLFRAPHRMVPAGLASRRSQKMTRGG